MSEATQILELRERGKGHAADELLPLVYDELRRLAAWHIANEQPGQTLQATALVHEAYTMAGIEIGYVESIALDPSKAEFRVTMHVERSAVERAAALID